MKYIQKSVKFPPDIYQWLEASRKKSKLTFSGELHRSLVELMNQKKAIRVRP